MLDLEFGTGELCTHLIIELYNKVRMGGSVSACVTARLVLAGGIYHCGAAQSHVTVCFDALVCVDFRQTKVMSAGRLTHTHSCCASAVRPSLQGNIILTDGEYRILSLLRSRTHTVKADEAEAGMA